MSATFNVFVTISNLSFINVKNLKCVVNDSVNYFNFNKNEYEYISMFPKQRQIEIENPLYALVVNVGSVKFIEFLKALDGLHPGLNNCCTMTCTRKTPMNSLLNTKGSIQDSEDSFKKPDRFKEFVFSC